MNMTSHSLHKEESEKTSSPVLAGSRFAREFGLFDSVFHEVSDAIIILSFTTEAAQPVIEDVNQQFEVMTGYALDDVRTKEFLTFLDDTNMASHQNTLTAALRARHSTVFFCPWKCADGKFLKMNITIRPFTSDEECSRFICVLRHNSGEDENRNHAARDVKKQLLAAMHHHFRTPLNGILGYSEIIMSEMLGPVGKDSYRDYARDIHGAGQDLLELIDNLLELKELETPEFDLHEEKMSLPQLLEDSCRDILAEAEKNQISILVDAPADIPVFLGDPGRMAKLLASLLDNALKYTTPGGKIILSATMHDDDSCTISCEDEGVGMLPQQVAKAFDHDNHTGDIYSDPATGIGFGLRYVKKIAEKHGGTAAIMSGYGKGTVVNIHLPTIRFSKDG